MKYSIKIIARIWDFKTKLPADLQDEFIQIVEEVDAEADSQN